MKYAISRDGELYHGEFSSIDEAKSEANSNEWTKYFVGECEPPSPPESWWNAEDWLEHVSVQDEYSCEWAEDWDDSTKEQREELEQQVRDVMASWLDRHQLRPRFYNIANPIEFENPDVCKSWDLEKLAEAAATLSESKGEE